jgi:DNA-binding MarR family transcriptional regulator
MSKRPPLKPSKIAPGVFAAISGELTRNSASAQERRKDLLVSWLFETSIRLQTSFDRRLKQFGMTLQEASVLFRCVESRKMTHGELTMTIGRDVSKVTRFLRRLEARQLITRGSDRNDRRLSVIKPTRDGKKLAAELTCVFDSVRKRLFRGIRDSDLRETEQILRQLYKNAVRAGSQRQKSLPAKETGQSMGESGMSRGRTSVC